MREALSRGSHGVKEGRSGVRERVGVGGGDRGVREGGERGGGG